MYALMAKLALSIQSDLIVAITAVHWPAVTGLKRYFGILATLGAYYREHLAGSVAIAIVSVACLLFRLTAFRATFRFVSIASGLE